jgi:SAM-dependent methyltransferase
MPTDTLRGWFETPLGQYLLERERAYLDEVTPDIFGFHALQLGMGEVDLLRENRITHKMRIGASGPVDVLAKCPELPIATQSIDLVVLAHVLEFADEPHAVLREVDRVMMPEGHLVILGFNPWSLWGLRSALGFSREQYPWNGRFVSLPFDSERWRRRFAFMEPAGDRWWAVGGAVYMLQAIKRVRGMRIITPAWQEKTAREKALVAAAKRQGHEGAKTAAHLRVVK